MYTFVILRVVVIIQGVLRVLLPQKKSCPVGMLFTWHNVSSTICKSFEKWIFTLSENYPTKSSTYLAILSCSSRFWVYWDAMLPTKGSARIGNRCVSWEKWRYLKIICTWVAISQKGANWEKNLRDRQGWTPIVFEDIQANDALTVDVAVIDAGTKCHFWRLEWVLRGKVDI